MPALSKRTETFTDSVIRRMTRISNKYGAVNLSQGFPDFEPPRELLDRLAEVTREDFHQYSITWGAQNFREALARKQSRLMGVDIYPNENIVVTCGSTEAMMAAMMTVTNPGDKVIVFSPFYENYGADTILSGAEPIYVPLYPPEFNFNPDELEAAFRQKPKALILCNPSNPTGTLYTKAEILAIGDICRRHDLFLVSDEAYREFCYTEEPYFSVMQIPGMENNAILVDSASKRYNLCGARIGCLVSKNKEFMALVMKYAQARLCPPVLGQVAAVGAIDTDDSYFEAVRKEYIARRDFTIDALNGIPGVYSPKPMGAFYTVAELPVDDAAVFCKWLLTDFRLDGETVMLTPAEPFYSTPMQGRNQVRVAYVLEIPALRRAMHILEKALELFNKVQL